MILYHGPLQQRLLNTHRATLLGARETLAQGVLYDSPRHAQRHIQHFVKAYHIDLSDLLLPNLSDYRTFNEFFYRRLRAGARPVEGRGDEGVVGSMADCRLAVFESVESARRFWIKGRDFTLRELLQDDELAEELDGGEVAIFRVRRILVPSTEGQCGVALADLDCQLSSPAARPSRLSQVTPDSSSCLARTVAGR